MSHVTRMNESCHAWMSHVSRRNKACHVGRNHVSGGMSHICDLHMSQYGITYIQHICDLHMSHVPIVPPGHLNQISCLIEIMSQEEGVGPYRNSPWSKIAMRHIRKRRISYINESCLAYGLVMRRYSCEWVMSHIWMSHVSHMNESCLTYEWVMFHV